MAKKAATPEEKPELLVRAHKFFERAEAAESDQRALELDDLKFVGLLEQWPEELRRVRELDPSGSRPCLTVDKVNQYKNQIVNTMRMNTPSIRVKPVDSSGDENVAEIYDGLIRHIENKSHADDAYDWAGEGAVDTGIGYLRIVTEYVGDSFDQEICVKKIANRFSVYRDPDSTEVDGSDQMECMVTEFMRRDLFKKTYPGKKESEWESSTGDSDRWCTEHEVRIAEYFYIELKDDVLYLLEDGNSVYQSDYTEDKGAILKERPAQKRHVKWAKLSGSDVLEEGEFAGEYIPVIPVMGIVTVVDGKMHWRGIVRGAKDPQRLYNYNRSTIAENLGLAIKAPFIGAVGQFDTAGDKWASANSTNYAYLEYDPVTTDDGVLAPAPQRQGFQGVPAGLMADIQLSEHDIQSGMGMYQASIGQDSNAKSGKALNAQRQQGDVATFHFPDNRDKSIRHVGRILVSIIPKYYDTRRVERVLGEDGTSQFVQIDPASKEAYKEQPGVNGIEKIYNLGVGKYDVVVTTGSSYSTKRQEGAEFLTQVVQTNPELMNVVGDYLFKSMDVPYHEEIAERMQKMLPPELQAGDKEEAPEVMQIKQQADQVIQQLQGMLQTAEQTLLEANEEAKELKAKANDKDGELLLKQEELRIKMHEAETKRIQVELTALQNQEVIDPSEVDALKAAVAQLIDMIAPPEPITEVITEPAPAGFLMPE